MLPVMIPCKSSLILTSSVTLLEILPMLTKLEAEYWSVLIVLKNADESHNRHFQISMGFVSTFST